MSKKYGLEDYYDDEEDLYYEEENYYEQSKPKPKPNQNQNQKKQTTIVNQQKPNPKPTQQVNSNSSSKGQNKQASSLKVNQVSDNKEKDLKEKCKFISIEAANTKYITNNKTLTSFNNKTKQSLNLIAIGHVDSGKSTLLGHLLFKLGKVSDRQLEKFEKECKSIGKTTFHFAWALDENKEERQRGVTVDIAYKSIETNRYLINLMDAPGHRDFVPNMIAGASQADVALLIIDSSPSSFENGFFSGGQTREHAILAYSLGVKEVIVVINKMEVSNWSEERYNAIYNNMKSFLEGVGFNEKSIYFLPASGLLGVNLIKEKENLDYVKWYQGPSIMEIIDNINIEEKLDDLPLRFSITDITKGTVNSRQGIEVFGKVITGVLNVNSVYGLFPLGNKLKIRTINSYGSEVKELQPGSTAEMLIEIDETVFESIKQGMIISDIANPIPVVQSFTFKMMTLDTIDSPLLLGQRLIFHSNSAKVNGKIMKIHQISKGDKIKKNSPIIPKEHYALIDVDLDCQICVEVNININCLSRMTIRNEGKTVGYGVVERILK